MEDAFRHKPVAVCQKGGNFIYPMMLRGYFYLLFTDERAFEGFEGDF